MPNLNRVRREVLAISKAYRGPPIEKGIVDLVVALRYWGINTTGSCHGHLNHGCRYPWVNMAIPKESRSVQGKKRWLKKIKALGVLVESYNESRDFLPSDEYLVLHVYGPLFARLEPRSSEVLDRFPRELIQKKRGKRMLKRYRRAMKGLAKFLVIQKKKT